jgi:toxin FitB
VSGYLLDTNIVSAFAPGKRAAHPDNDAVAAWLERQTEELFLSAMTVTEIQAGIAKARRTGAQAKAEQVASWLERLVESYADRILPFDLAAARMAGSMADKARAMGREPGTADIIIAATAQVHEHTVVTRNVAHFRPLGVAVHNPYPGR